MPTLQEKNDSNNYEVVCFDNLGSITKGNALDDTKKTSVSLIRNEIHIDNKVMRDAVKYPDKAIIRMFDGRINIGAFRILCKRMTTIQDAIFALVEYDSTKGQIAYFGGVGAWGFTLGIPEWRGITPLTWDDYMRFCEDQKHIVTDRNRFTDWLIKVRQNAPQKVHLIGARTPIKTADPVPQTEPDQNGELVLMPEEGKIDLYSVYKTQVEDNMMDNLI